MIIDFNADIAEGYPHDAALMEHVQSVNIACGAHAGDPLIMVQTLREAKRRGLRVGAHPGYFDRANFGRTMQTITPEELRQIVGYQLAALKYLADEVGITVSYVKPHGAMYHQACQDRAMADALVTTAQAFGLAVMGLPHSQMQTACERGGVRYIKEGFADRRYRTDGSLVPRTEKDAMLHDPVEAAKQIKWLVSQMGAETICVHGDETESVEFVRAVRQLLQ